MKKMRLIGTIIGVAGAIGAVAAIVYKKFKEKQAMVNTPQEKTLLLLRRIKLRQITPKFRMFHLMTISLEYLKINKMKKLNLHEFCRLSFLNDLFE